MSTNFESIQGGGDAEWRGNDRHLEALSDEVVQSITPYALYDHMIRYEDVPSNEAASVLDQPAAGTSDTGLGHVQDAFNNPGRKE